MRFLGGRSGNKKNPACVCGHSRLNHWDYHYRNTLQKTIRVNDVDVSPGERAHITRCRFKGCDCAQFKSRHSLNEELKVAEEDETPA